MTVTLLKKLQEVLQKEVCNKIELRESIDEKYNLVNPSCFIGWIPPKTSLIESMQKQNSIPCMVIGAGKSIDTGESEEVEITLHLAVYSPGFEDEKGLSPNYDGYVDLLNLMDKTKAFLLRDSFNFDFMIINSELESGLYEEQAYPTWFGYIKFKARYNAYPNIDTSKYL